MKTTGCKAMLITVAAVLISTWAPSLYAQPDKVILDLSNIPGGKTRPAVTFPHNRHVEAGPSCKDCHHLFKDGKNVLDEGTLEEGKEGIRCSACHGPKSRLNLEQAFHNQCIGCHRKLWKENKKTGPRFCGKCHVKKQ
ncbi:MAG TPA: cytochrome c3 family protein [Thermodesulfobacteriota bacterium]|nr:cytochrome c3 family protein [Thermodesulfobacteriota bacterium]